MNPIYKVPWYRPALIADLGSQFHVDVLIFKMEHDGAYLPVPEWENHQYRYRCMDCYAACGTDRDVFATKFARAKFLKDGPTEEQSDQMSEHARQHGIMYLWAKGLI